jgi:hypothetical protein
MHESRDISCVMWKDKCPVLLISNHAMPVGFPCVPRDEVPRRNGVTQEFIPTSLVLREYTTYMRGVDVADQLRALYSSQTRSHRLWYCIFLVPGGYDGSKYIHHVLESGSAGAKSSFSTHDAPTVQDCIGGGSFT